MDLKPLLTQALSPKRLPVMLKKLLKRVRDGQGSLSPQRNLAWLEAQACDFGDWAKKRSPTLWKEAQRTSTAFGKRAQTRLKRAGVPLGGGGAYPLLYFLTRWAKPRTVVETGVAAGFSSHAFLTALKKNRRGRLFSSDFPYFRLPHPERFIGMLVEGSLREGWTLFIDGDEANLPRILGLCGPVDLFHYDSDKSVSGRKFALTLISPRMAPQGLLLMDDLQDNSFFHDQVTAQTSRDWKVFRFQGKYVGLIGGDRG